MFEELKGKQQMPAEREYTFEKQPTIWKPFESYSVITQKRKGSVSQYRVLWSRKHLANKHKFWEYACAAKKNHRFKRPSRDRIDVQYILQQCTGHYQWKGKKITHLVFPAIYFKKGDGSFAVDLISWRMPKVAFCLYRLQGE